MVVKVDDFVIDNLYQRFANLFQKTTGKTCFYLAKGCFALASVAIMMLMITRMSNGMYGQKIGFIMALDMLLGLLCLRVIPIISIIEADLANAKNVANPARYNLNYKFMRIVLAMFFLMQFINLMHTASIKNSLSMVEMWGVVFLGFLICGMYFKACVPQPPQKSWIAKLVGKLKEIVDGIFHPVPNPASAG